MGSPRQIVLLCAEEDDLALVGVVHLGRQLGLQLQVIAELECDDGPFLDAVNGCDRGVFAIVRSPHLDQARAAQLAATFEIARVEGLEWVELTLDPSPEETLRPALTLLQDIDAWEPPRLGSDLVTGRFTPATTPVVHNPGLGPIHLSDPAFEREANTASSVDFDATGANRLTAFGPPSAGALDLLDDVPTRSRAATITLSAACLVLLGAGAWWQWHARAAPERQASAPAEIRVVEAAAVPVDEDEEQDEPADQDQLGPDTPPAEAAAATPKRPAHKRKRRRRRRR